MTARVANCPNCGAEVTFQAGSSLLTICGYCSSAVARVGDDVGELEILGKVAPLAPLSSPLRLGTVGHFEKRSFSLVGRVQPDWGQGPWNEWYAAFDDGTWGWIAEAQGKLYLTFPQSADLPPYFQARVGAKIPFGRAQLTVVERRRARYVAAEGELPAAIIPDSYYNYCDLEGPGGAFGTIDYGDNSGAPQLYLGRRHEYSDLFSDLDATLPNEPAAAAVGLNCPNCGSAVALRAPDTSQRVACDACGSLLDCSRGNQLFLLSSARRDGPEPLIPLGSQGQFKGGRWTLIGHLVRSVEVDFVRYPWEEYLLRGDKNQGFRWLVLSENHWSWVEPLPAGELEHSGSRAQFRGQSYRAFQTGSAQVDAIRGEFYWKVEVGERVMTADFVAPPQMLSREVSDEEVNWSLGTYLTPKEVQEAFGLKVPLPRPRGVAPHQPNPRTDGLKAMAKLGLYLSGALLVFGAINWMASDAEKILEADFIPNASLAASTGQDRIQAPVWRSEPFQFNGRDNLEVMVAAQTTGWVFLEGHLATADYRKLGAFGVLAQASGTIARRTVLVGEIPPGQYTLALTPEWPKGAPADFIQVRLRRDVFAAGHVGWWLFFLWLFPVIQWFRYLGFERQRWAQSEG